MKDPVDVIARTILDISAFEPIEQANLIVAALSRAGLVIVPVEPTISMTAAGQEVVWKGGAAPRPVSVQVVTATFDKIYRAMLATYAAKPAQPLENRNE